MNGWHVTESFNRMANNNTTQMKMLLDKRSPKMTIPDNVY